MEYQALPDGPLHTHNLLAGCYIEAQRAETIACCLEQLRQTLANPDLHGQIYILIDAVRQSSRHLLELADRAQIYVAGAPVTASYLNVLLPCMSRTLRDMDEFYKDKTLSRELRWRTMWHKMKKEAGDIPLPVRFQMYNHFLTVLGLYLVRSKRFDINTLELLNNNILKLREQQQIAPPVSNNQQLVVQQTMMMAMADRRLHWAEDIFSRPLSCRTPLKKLEKSVAYGPWVSGGVKTIINPKILFRRPFNHDRLSVMAIMDTKTDTPHMVIGEHHPAGQVYSDKTVRELCISRDGSALILKRWSHSRNAAVLWAVLYFHTWEEMVLFYCSFVSLKYLSKDGQVAPDEFKLGREKRLFQARIIDDEYAHLLIVYKDLECKGVRLFACVWEGELRQCPVWTAFVTHSSKSATWLVRKSADSHVILLNDLQPYVFCSAYQPNNNRQNKTGAFEIRFNSDEAATRFKEVFYPTMSSVASSDAGPPRARSAERRSDGGGL